MPFIRNNPQGYVVDIFDGFGAHLYNHESLQMRLGVNIISIKEEFDSYPINQAYNKQVARSDKMVQRQSLYYLRLFHPSKNFINQ